ncbi:MAG: hypothetical protein V1837_07175 [Candidatus Woesearchaeota archaeon]
MIKGKSGLESQTVVILCVILASAVVLMFTVKSFGETITNSGDIEACRLTVITAAKVKTFGETIGTKCPRHELTLTLKDATVGTSINADAIKEKIAEEMRTCYYKMSGKQQLNPYAESKMPFEKQNICLVCSEISFAPDLQKKLPEINNFGAFLKDSNYSFMQVKTANVLWAIFPTTKQYKTTELGTDSFSTKNAYYLIYNTESPDWWRSDNLFNRALRVALGDFAVSDSYSVMLLMPSSDIGTLQCTSYIG